MLTAQHVLTAFDRVADHRSPKVIGRVDDHSSRSPN